MQKKFSFPLKIDELKQNQYKYVIEADAEELKDITEILQIEKALKVKAVINLKFNRRENVLRLWGEIAADLRLQSVISLNFFTKKIKAPFELFYDTKATYQDIRDLKAGINDDVPDIIIEGILDLADVVLEQIALNIDDYPRAPGEEFNFADYSKEDFVSKENPFSILSQLKK